MSVKNKEWMLIHYKMMLLSILLSSCNFFYRRKKLKFSIKNGGEEGRKLKLKNGDEDDIKSNFQADILNRRVKEHQKSPRKVPLNFFLYLAISEKTSIYSKIGGLKNITFAYI